MKLMLSLREPAAPSLEGSWLDNQLSIKGGGGVSSRTSYAAVWSSGSVDMLKLGRLTDAVITLLCGLQSLTLTWSSIPAACGWG